jgi:HEAT repeat protein
MSPIGVGREHDSIKLYSSRLNVKANLSEPPATEVVNAAIHLFAMLFPLQPSRVQESVIEQLRSFMFDSSLQRDPARKEAISVNISMALLGALKVAVRETTLAPGDIRNESVNTLMKSLLRGFLIHPDQYVRHVAAQALGRLAKIAGNHFTVKEVDELIDLIVANREPSARSGCAMALGQIHSQLGGMAAGLHLKKILGVLNSLSSDPHPTVHIWALESISRLSSSAGLNFAPYVTSTLGLLAQLYYSDSHNEEVGSQAWSNLEVDFPTPAVITRCVGSLINVLGPDLQEMTKTRELIMMLIEKFGAEQSPLIIIESLRCQEHLSLYAPSHLDFSAYVRQLQEEAGSPVPQIRSAALDGLHNIMRRDSDDVLASALPGLEEKLWLLLDENPDEDVVKKIIWNWLQQSGVQSTALWVKRCSTILMKITVKKSNQPTNTAPVKPSRGQDFQDEEVAGFAAATGTAADEVVDGSSAQELLKWQTRTFAMSVLSELIRMVERDALQNVTSAAEDELQGKVADVIRIAFSASTTGAIALRIKGLQIINQLLRVSESSMLIVRRY